MTNPAIAIALIPSMDDDCHRMRILLALTFFAVPVAAAAEPELVFSVKTWEGEYTTSDRPGGVDITPTVGAIYTVNADGSGLRKVIQPGGTADYPLASGDGKWVYFQSDYRGSMQIHRCRWDGSGAESLTDPAAVTRHLATPESRFEVKQAYGYGLSADGTRLVYTVHDGASGRVVIANVDGSSAAFVAPKLGYIYMAKISPKNESVVTSGPAKGYRLQLIGLATGEVIDLTPDHPDSYAPQFTPDGRTIVFFRRDGDVYRVDADGKGLQRLTEGNRYVEFRLSPKDRHGSTDGPDVSPDGKRVAFIAQADGVPNVFVVNLDGTGKRQVTTRKSPCGRVKWSPDGTQLSFVSFEGKYPQLFVVNSDGGEPRQLTRLDGGVIFAHWK